MNEDIVTRLRKEVMWVQHKTKTKTIPDPLCQEAADEIERLRWLHDALIAQLQEAIDAWTDGARG
jgi:hypothetical protein